MTGGCPAPGSARGHLEPTRLERPDSAPRIIVAGMGSEWRRDDGVGSAVVKRFEVLAAGGAAKRCEVVTSLSDPLDLLMLWDRADLAVVVDAMRSGLAPGAVSSIDLCADLAEQTSQISGESSAKRTGARRSEVPPAASSTHVIGLRSVLLLSRVIDRAPRRVVVVGVQGLDFGTGGELSPDVASSIDEAARRVLELVEDCLACA